jgi:glutathione synthase/RimK-type ligase-like ATP-grasp enzyme
MQKSLGYRVRRLSSNSNFQLKPWHKFINWGNGNGHSNLGHIAELLRSNNVVIINRSDCVSSASNKLTTFNKLKDIDGIRIPTFTTDAADARSWLDAGIGVVCRTKLSGHSGDGIVLVTEKGAEIPRAPLYVQYIKKQKEFRVHVAFGEVIDVQEKRKRRDLPEEFQTNFQVRNHHTGWVYCREDVQPPQDAAEMAIEAVRTLGLDFGAVDLIWNEKRNETYVLEINTAPGLEGTTVTKYSEAFVKALATNEVRGN